MLKIGDRAPDFALPDDAGNTVTLRGLLENGPVVLYFYPADFTPVCTKEACMFRDRHAELVAAGVRVVGVSPQGASTHAGFKKTLKLPFPLLADPRKSAIRAYGAAGFLGLFTQRVSYLISRAGLIEDVERADLSVSRHAGFVDRVLARASSPSAPPTKGSPAGRG
jgi:peroxiredoxin Q/BCP